jgi:copper chaperone NosL
MDYHITKISRLLLVLASVCLVAAIFLPIWRIELDAPQYPEGLMLLIYADKIGGQVDIINGLNHYIGMQTLHAENFIEFTILPYIIGLYALIIFVTSIVNKKEWLYFAFVAFLLFGILAMADFWRWEYNYGHNLDPNAAIIVPGMSYQPPLIGFKQLLNFGAYSIPDMGGWLFIVAGALMLLAVLIEKKIFSRKKNITV